MLNTMIEWFKNLSEGWQTAIFGAVVAVGLTVIAGLFALIKWLFTKKKDPDLALAIIDDTLKENKQLRQTVKKLEEQLAKPSLETSISSEKSIPVPSAEAKELANLITQDDSPYAQALKAIAEGKNRQADTLLDETQRFVDHHIQQAKDKAQTKIFIARMQNASYAGRPQDALQWCEMLKPLAGEDSQILNEMAVVYYNNANYKEAEPLMKRALAIDEASFGKNHPAVAIRLNNLALLYKATNRLSKAEPMYKRALAIDEASFGKDHPDVARDLNNLAALYYTTNRLAEAEPLMKRALAIDEASFGKDHPNVATRLNNLALLYQDTNRLAEAEPLMKRVVEILENPGGEPLPNYAVALNNLAQLYKETNRLSEAEPLMKRALEIGESSLGKDHPKVAIRLNNLALLYKATNRLSEAEPLMKRALAIDEASLGKDHPNVARDLNNLAQLYKATNRLAEAEPLMKRALAIDEASFGKDHPNVARDLNNLALLYKATNRLSEAEPLIERHLVIFLQFTRQTGHPHPHLKAAFNNYTVLLMQMGYSKDEVDARLNRLAPEMFKSK